MTGGATTALVLACVLTAAAPVASAHDLVDAGVYNNITETYYFFFDGQYVAKPLGRDLGNARPLSAFGGNFPASWMDGVDAATFNANTERYYFFKYVATAGEWQFIAKPFGAGEDFTAPKSMDTFAASDFPAQCAVDAATYDPIGRVYYFFDGDGSYCSQAEGASRPFEVRAGAFASGYPSDFGLQAVAARIGTAGTDGVFFFFSADTYVRKERGGDGFSSPSDTRTVWSGWPTAHGTPAAVRPLAVSLPEALFTDPEAIVAGTASPVIKERVIDLIGAAEGEVVLQSYLLDDPDVNAALVEAHERGAHVTVLVDNDEEDGRHFNGEPPTHALRGSIDDARFVDTDGILHNKVGLFSRVRTTGGDVENVVFSSSSNFFWGAYNKFQDALIVSDAAIYDGFMRQAGQIKANDTSHIVSVPGAVDGMRAYFFPQNSGADTVEDVLNDLMTNRTWGALESMTVRVNMGSWTAARSAVSEKLGEIARRPGSRVEVIASGWKELVDEASIRNGIGEGSADYNFLRRPSNLNTHSKYMLVDVTYRSAGGAATTRKIVYAGSQNFTGAALRTNFESWTRIINAEIYDAYEANFREIWDLTLGSATDSENAEPDLVEEPTLSEVFPNPANSDASVVLVLNRTQSVRAAVYDVLGREVALLHQGPLGAGTHRFTVVGRNQPSGVYFARFVGDRFDVSRRAVVSK